MKRVAFAEVIRQKETDPDLLKNLDDSMKFLFEREVYESISTLFGQYEACEPFVRLPYERCWFEYDIREEIRADGSQYVTVLGMLLYQKDCGRDDPTIFMDVFVPKFKSATGKELAVQSGNGHGHIFSAVFVPGTKNVAHKWHTEINVDNDEKQDMTVWTNVYLTSFTTAFLNCKNIGVDPVEGYSHKRNARLLKENNKPFYSYNYVTIGRQKREKNGRILKHDSPRLHTVRGHFKIRKSGIYWWQPFIRGDKRKGVVHKEYRAAAI